jgi:hypothetical protein
LPVCKIVRISRAGTGRLQCGRAPEKAATRIKKPTDTRMPSGQTENLITEHLTAQKLSKLAADVDELSRICKLAR